MVYDMYKLGWIIVVWAPRFYDGTTTYRKQKRFFLIENIHGNVSNLIYEQRWRVKRLAHWHEARVEEATHGHKY